MFEWFAYVGCRTSRERAAIGEGISVFGIDGAGDWQLIDVQRELENPAWLTFDARTQVLYAAHGDRHQVSAFRADQVAGWLTPFGALHCEGRNPVHISLSPSSRHLVVTNHVKTDEYASGLVSVAIGEDGALQRTADRMPFEGKAGPHRIEQPFPKPHQAVFDPSGRWIVVPDKGTNELVVTGMDANGCFQGKVIPVVSARETAGPRHIAFHPDLPFAYIINELDSTILVCRFDAAKGELTPIQYLTAVRPTCVVDSRGGEIAISSDGQMVFVSNRGDNTIGGFFVESDGRLSPAGWIPTGRTPRFFVLHPDNHALFAASEEEHTIIRYPIDTGTGQIGHPKVVAQVGSPTCVVIVKAA